MNTNEMMDKLIEYGICTDDELRLVTAINGTNEKTMCDILYVRTGYNSFEAFLDE